MLAGSGVAVFVAAAVGASLGAAVGVLVGEPQNLLIAEEAGWEFVEFAARMAPVTAPVFVVGLLTCLLVVDISLVCCAAPDCENIDTFQIFIRASKPILIPTIECFPARCTVHVVDGNLQDHISGNPGEK